MSKWNGKDWELYRSTVAAVADTVILSAPSDEVAGRKLVRIARGAVLEHQALEKHDTTIAAIVPRPPQKRLANGRFA